MNVVILQWGASKNYAPITEYATNGSFCSQDENIYYLGNGDINYYIKNNDDNLQNISGDNSIIIETDKIKSRKIEIEQENYSDEWAKTYNRYIHVKVGHDYTNRDMIRVRM